MIDGLKHIIEARNELAREFQQSTLNDEHKAELYFGLRNARGITDERIKNNIDALSLYTDDSIWFSKILADDLLKYGKRRRKHFSWRFNGLPKFAEESWAQAEAQGLIPPDF